MKTYNKIYTVHAWKDNNKYFTVTQGEGGIKYPRLKVVDDNGAIDLTGSSITYTVTLPRGSEEIVDVSIINATEGTVEFEIKSSMTKYSGIANGELNIAIDNKVLKISGINLTISSATNGHEIESSEQFSALVEALAKVVMVTPEGTAVIPDNSVVGDKLAENTVTENKLSNGIKSLLYTSTALKWGDALSNAITGQFCFSDVGKRMNSTSYTGAIIPVDAGEELKITAKTSSANAQLIAFYSEYNYVADTEEHTGVQDTYVLDSIYGTASTTYTDEIVTIPSGVKWIGVQSYRDTKLVVQKVALAYEQPVKEVLFKTNNTLDSLMPNAKTDSETVIVSTPSVFGGKYNPIYAYDIATGGTARCIYIDGNYLYHTGNNYFAVSKVDISNPLNPNNIITVGGHAKCYPRGLSVGNGYMYIAYRDNAAATKTSFGETDIGGYLDIIKMSNFTPVKSIAYSRKQYDPGDGKGIRYFGKSHYTATHGSGLLCVTQQMGGWLLYDISSSPENPTLLYEYDNREQIYIDNVDDKGYAEFQQPCFFEHNNTVYLAIAGYDRDLVSIYDLSTPSSPQCVKTINIRVLWNGSETDKLIHTMGIANSGDYLYLTIAPYPNITDNTMCGMAVIDVSNGIDNLSCKLMSIPVIDMCKQSSGEPAPASISICDNKLLTDNGNNAFCLWDITDKSTPSYCGTYPNGNISCGVCCSEDLFAIGLSSEKTIQIYGYNGVADIIGKQLLSQAAQMNTVTTSGEGSLIPASTDYEGCECNYYYSVNGNVATVSLNIISLLTDKSHIQMSELPVPTTKVSSALSFVAYSTKNNLINISVSGTELFIDAFTSTFIDGEQVSTTITYITA